MQVVVGFYNNNLLINYSLFYCFISTTKNFEIVAGT